MRNGVSEGGSLDRGHGLLENKRELVILVVDSRPLFRECIVSFLNQFPEVQAIAAASPKDYLSRAKEKLSPTVVLFCVDSDRLPASGADVFAEDECPAPIVVLSNDRVAGDVVGLLKGGVRGFIPTSVSMEVAVQALRLVHAGGTFVPESCLRSLPTREQTTSPERSGFFTHRQLQVVEAIRQGKPNKIIAYELSMCESTVKVHVRTIMKKLKARNRTQVAYLYASTSGLEGNQSVLAVAENR
jgi:DNA-binding NarL/FixJ family response regulator